MPRVAKKALPTANNPKAGVLRLAKEDQVVFWQALQHPPTPTRAQRALGKLVRSLL